MNQDNKALTALARSMKRALKTGHGVEVPHAALRACLLQAQGENPHAYVARKQGPADQAELVRLRQLVAEAPHYFHPGYDFDGKKLQWLERAGLLHAPSPAAGELRVLHLVGDELGCLERLALDADGEALLPDDLGFDQATIAFVRARVPSVRRYGLPDYLSAAAAFFGERFELALAKDFRSDFLDSGDDSGDECRVYVRMDDKTWSRVVDTALRRNATFANDVSEWVGLHYQRVLGRESAVKRTEWVERFLEAHTDEEASDAEFFDPARQPVSEPFEDDNTDKVTFEFVYSDEDGDHVPAVLHLHSGEVTLLAKVPEEAKAFGMRTRIWVTCYQNDLDGNGHPRCGEGEDFIVYWKQADHGGRWMTSAKDLKAIRKLLDT